ncbi:MAG: polyprenyl synthetase family protein [Clostridia bacterium]|nr:polyprenyl synthetase family protein [Clostridia bacterium]
MAVNDIKNYMDRCADLVERDLAAAFECGDSDIASLYDAMRYSTLGGGKRIRAFLTLEFCRMFGGDEDSALAFASALEMVHAFSLIHDDLPCMDDDDMRRGKPSCHIKYGEAHALIAGDALIMLAFSHAASAVTDAQTALYAVRVISERAGARGMCGGQAMDMYAESTRVSYEYLCKLQSLKTGALIEAAVMLGCISAGVKDKRMQDAVRYASCIGRAFQIIDDILDIEGDEAILGKHIGSDAESEKTTFVTELGLEGARAEAARLTDEAVACVSGYSGAENLIALAKWLYTRKN